MFETLTEKQREVMDLLVENHTSKEIAAKLGISESAVNQRIEAVRMRMGGVVRSELARAYRQYRTEEPDGHDDISNDIYPASTIPRREIRVASQRRGDVTARFLRMVGIACGILLLGLLALGVARLAKILS
ncbi:helix-turn-helix transcriptional regulator [Novosphingobium sp. PC22D]|uniref:helix-turn-helix domain-containing protein n=1 Tax=Novosphingobium sp. PC22D TaxID=1962403 RepID=UPI000BEF66C6|nr:helix-turn-helix transcriptional regulator [Novosphingobium sp. PC22D]